MEGEERTCFVGIQIEEAVALCANEIVRGRRAAA